MDTPGNQPDPDARGDAPRLLFKGANILPRRELRPTLGDHEATLDLASPPGMFTDVLRAALNLTEEQSDRARIELVSHGLGSVRYHGW